MRIAVLGAGAWGTALAIAFGARHAVTLWSRDSAQAATGPAAEEPDCRLNQQGREVLFLPDSFQERK